MPNLNAIADVLEKIAAFLDAEEQEKVASIRDQRSKLAQEFGQKYEELTGEHVDDDTMAKLANADQDLLMTIEKMVEATSREKTAEIGGPSDRFDPYRPSGNNKQDAEAADRRFLDWVMQP